MKENIIAVLGANYKSGDDKVIEKFINRYTSIASDKSHRKKDDELLIPYIEEAVIEAYLRRGDEGSSSSSEGGLSTSYIDIEQKLAHDVLSIRSNSRL